MAEREEPAATHAQTTERHSLMTSRPGGCSNSQSYLTKKNLTTSLRESGREGTILNRGPWSPLERRDIEDGWWAAVHMDIHRRSAITRPTCRKAGSSNVHFRGFSKNRSGADEACSCGLGTPPPRAKLGC